MTSLRLAAASAILACVAAGPALAQSAAPPAGSNATVPEKTAPGTAPATNLDRTSGSLSKKLGQTDGVIKPSGNVDPDMHVPAPRTGAMPVIKPNETGGGVAK